ncbi:Tn3 family transposase [Jannaschia rubra]|uniref:Transposase, TnpA family n=1 Tax=Jannaschia rubra TaxID=282197 RepID=A0A0M6XWB3_9RHOB|nr:Tn3 family transposase [Jannaschia rubra]CTQ34867.1 Transposase, TnpA family [Jannaschia rubra]SFG67208.1 Transposase and inactivated derivatives, TnpA family [Jannaschia rubra]
MAHRTILTSKQRDVLFGLPTDDARLLKHYTLSDEDLAHINRRRRPRNRLGFALQLCALRYPGRALLPEELIPAEITRFLAAQLGLKDADLDDYAAREETRHEHMAALRKIYGHRSLSGLGVRHMRAWLEDQAELAISNEDIARRFIEQCRRTRTILPAISTVERLCADALVVAERRIEARIADRLSGDLRRALDALLEDMVDDRLTRFVWLRQFEVGSNSAGARRLLDRLDDLQRFELPPEVFQGVPEHRVIRLRRQGERYYADGLRDLPDDRRHAILVVCVVEWRRAIADAVVETHDRIVGRTWREAARLSEAELDGAQPAVRKTLRAFRDMGTALLEAKTDGASLEGAISSSPGWTALQSLVAVAARLTDTLSSDPISHVMQGHRRFRRYAPRMLRLLEIEGAEVARPLLAAAEVIRSGKAHSRPTQFLRRTSKWHRHLKDQVAGDDRLWEVAVMFHLRDAFRSGDIWLANSRRYGDMKHVLVPAQAAEESPRLAVPLDPEDWLSDRRARMDLGLERLSRAARSGAIPGGSIENGVLQLSRLPTSVPSGADELVVDLYRRIPETRITDILLDVDRETRFTESFPHLRTGAPPKDRIGLLNVLLAEGLNLGLSKMAEASNSHGFWELLRLSRWHLESDAYARALASVVEAQANLPMARLWGLGTTASSDGQFFPTTRQGEAMNLVNAKYGSEPGLKVYTHVSDQFAPFASRTIPATVSEAPYILDGLLNTETGKRIREQYADTGGFTDHVFAVTSILGHRFIPRIRDLPSKRLYVFDPRAMPSNLRGLSGGMVRERLIASNWPDILRVTATMTAGTVAPSQILRKFASYPRQNDLAAALREVGRVERTLFMIEWVLDTDMQRRAQIGLNKGEAHHALKNALRIGRQGEIRDRTAEGQHYRMAALNLLAAIVIYWNTARLGEAVTRRTRAGLPVPPELLAHTSPLGWAHILLTGEYKWPKR